MRKIVRNIGIALWFVVLSFPVVVIAADPLNGGILWRWQNALLVGFGVFVLLTLMHCFEKTVQWQRAGRQNRGWLTITANSLFHKMALWWHGGYPARWKANAMSKRYVANILQWYHGRYVSVAKNCEKEMSWIHCQLADSVKRRDIFIVLFFITIVYPLLSNDYSIGIMVMALLYVMLGLGLNIVVGMAGLLDLGFVAFYAVGAYSYALLNKFYDIGFWTALPIGGVLAAIFGILLGFPILRLRGDYLAIVTLGFGEIIRLILQNWTELTNGVGGIAQIPAPTFFGADVPVKYNSIYLYYVMVALVILTIFVVNRLQNSRLGRAWIALREDDIACQAMGIDKRATKLAAFSLGAFWAGLAGVVFAAQNRYINPESFTFLESAIILAIVVLGGMGSIVGVILGAFILILLPEYLREFAEYKQLAFGAILVLMMVFRPQGLISTVKRRYPLDSIRSRKEKEEKLENKKNQTAKNKTSILRVDSLSMDFGGIRALNNLSLELYGGEITALIGPNGAGKTTFFNCVTGVYQPTAGRVVLQPPNKGGQIMLQGRKPNRITRYGLARTFQNIRLFPQMTVLENVMIGRHCRSKASILGAIFHNPATRKEEKEILDISYSLLKKVGLESQAEDFAANLSYGAQRRLEIARALATEPLLLLLDEPAAGMNPNETQELNELILEIAADGLAVLLIEHDMKLVMSLSHRIFVMDYGSKIAEGTPEEIRNNPDVIKAYLGE